MKIPDEEIPVAFIQTHKCASHYNELNLSKRIKQSYDWQTNIIKWTYILQSSHLIHIVAQLFELQK